MFADSTFQERSDKSLSPLLKFDKKLVAPDCVAMLPNAGGSRVSPQIWWGGRILLYHHHAKIFLSTHKQKTAERTQQIKVSLSFCLSIPTLATPMRASCRWYSAILPGVWVSATLAKRALMEAVAPCDMIKWLVSNKQIIVTILLKEITMHG